MVHLLARYDFYIVSQAVRTGSVSPTHYNVIHDTSGLKPDHMQRLAYKLCHMYYNWQVCVSEGVCLFGFTLHDTRATVLVQQVARVFVKITLEILQIAKVLRICLTYQILLTSTQMVPLIPSLEEVTVKH